MATKAPEYLSWPTARVSGERHAKSPFRCRRTLPNGRKFEVYGSTPGEAQYRAWEKVKESHRTVEVKKRSDTVKAAIEAWLPLSGRGRRRLQPQSLEQKGGRFANYVYPLLGELSLSELTTPRIDDWYETLCESASTGVAEYVVRDFKAFARHNYRALSADVKETIEHLAPEAYSGEIGREFPLAVEAALKAAMVGCEYEAVFQLALWTGARQSEIFGMRLSSVNLQTGVWHIDWAIKRNQKEGLPKGQKTRRMTITPATLHVLCQYAEAAQPTRLMFEREGRVDEPICASVFMRKYWHRLLDRAGLYCAGCNHSAEQHRADRLLCRDCDCARYIAPYKFHSFRHTFATNLRRMGVPMEVISKCLGHATTAITEKIYAHWKDEMAAPAEEALAVLNPFNVAVDQPIGGVILGVGVTKRDVAA